MKFLVLGLVSIAVLVMLFLIDRKIKGRASIIIKVTSLAFFTFLIIGSVYLYSTTILESFQVDVRSFTKIKAFFSSRIVYTIILLVYALFVFIKTICVTFVLFGSNHVSSEKEILTFLLLSIVFDIPTIPNIINAGSMSVVLMILKITSILGTGLVLSKLVFSIAYNPVLRKVEC